MAIYFLLLKDGIAYKTPVLKKEIPPFGTLMLGSFSPNI